MVGLTFSSAGGTAVSPNYHAHVIRFLRSARSHRWTQEPPTGRQAAHSRSALRPGCRSIVALGWQSSCSAEEVCRSARRQEAAHRRPGGRAHRLALLNLSEVGEHTKLSQELRRAIDQADTDRRAAAAELSRSRSDSALDYVASLRRLEALHKVELEGTKAKAATVREQAWLERERLEALSNRLRSERDQARANSLLFNEEHNALRKEVAELRARRSEAAVRDATRCRLSFPGTCAE